MYFYQALFDKQDTLYQGLNIATFLIKIPWFLKRLTLF